MLENGLENQISNINKLHSWQFECKNTINYLVTITFTKKHTEFNVINSLSMDATFTN